MKKLSFVFILALMLAVSYQAAACYGTQISGPSQVFINSPYGWTTGSFAISVDPTLSQIHGAYLGTQWHTSAIGTVHTGDAVSLYFYSQAGSYQGTHDETVYANSHFADGYIWYNSATVRVNVAEEYGPQSIPQPSLPAEEPQNIVTVLNEKGEVIREINNIKPDDPTITEGLLPGLYIMRTGNDNSVKRFYIRTH